MSAKLKLSYSQLNLYTNCGERYNLHYNKKLRSVWFHAALAFGSAIDNGLNVLLKTNDRAKALAEFDKMWKFQYVNGQYTDLSSFEYLAYADTDFDKDLVSKEDQLKLGDDWLIKFNGICSRKDQVGYKFLDKEERLFYNLCCWYSLKTKGHVMIKSYDEQIMPRIKRTIAVQHKSVLASDQGDEVDQYLDIILEWEDGRILLMDNKTAAREYDDDAAASSQQLISYFFRNKADFNLNAVGFFVLRKQIQKNKIKTCTKCEFDGSGGRHKTCPNEIDGKRCEGAWTETIDPVCNIKIIINDVTDAAEQLVMSAFSEATHGIKEKHYYKNLSACKSGALICPYFSKCWKGSNEDLIEVKREEKLSSPDEKIIDTAV